MSAKPCPRCGADLPAWAPAGGPCEAEQARADLEEVVKFQTGMVSGLDAEAMGVRLVEDLRRREADARRARGMAEAEVPAAGSLFAGVNATDEALRINGGIALQPGMHGRPPRGSVEGHGLVEEVRKRHHQS